MDSVGYVVITSGGGMQKMMKISRLRLLEVAVFGWGVTSVAVASASSISSTEVSMGSRNYSWVGPSSQFKASQTVTPFNFGVVGSTEHGNFNMAMRTAYVMSDNYSVGRVGSVHSFSDTNASVSYFHKLDNAQPFVAFDVNVPTGKSTLRGAEKNALLDGFLVDQTRFGEGWNYSPSIGVSLPILDRYVITASVANTARGSFIPDGDNPFKFSPGDITTTLIGLAKKATDNYLINIQAVRVSERTSKVNGIGYFKSGDRLSISSQGQFSLSQTMRLGISFAYLNSLKNQYYDPAIGALAGSAKNTNSDTFNYGANLIVAHSGGYQTNTTISFTDRKSNQYLPTEDLFLPPRQKLLLGAELSKKMEGTTISGKLEYLNMNDGATPFAPVGTKYRGFGLEINAKRTF